MKPLQIFQAIPTNLVTGFLGAGKTTAIISLLERKPRDQRWAVLVNEFGDVGIDGRLLDSQSRAGEVYLRELAGGCMCCTAGLPMQIAINQLIAKARPHRLLIEPTGLGHPQELLTTFQDAYYQQLLSLRATLTLVDAHKLSDARYRQHAIFQQQLAVADRIVASKSDLYQDGDLQMLQRFLAELGLSDKPLSAIQNGALELDWLDAANGFAGAPANAGNTLAAPRPQTVVDEAALALPSGGYVRKDQQGDGFFASGWVFAPNYVFDAERLLVILSGLEVERLKGVFITADGIIAFNQSGSALTSFELDDSTDSRIEVIGASVSWQNLEASLLQAVIEQ